MDKKHELKISPYAKHGTGSLYDLLASTSEHEQFEQKQLPLFDEECALKLMSNNKILLTELLTLLITTSLPTDIALLQKAYSQRNWSDISYMAHKIHGGVIYCGTIRLCHACSACEYLEFFEITNSVAQLEKLYQRIISTAEDTSHTLQVRLRKPW